MTASYLVVYEGEPDDPDEFYDYYVNTHLPLVWGFPEIRRIEIMRGVDNPGIFMITRLVFDDVHDLRRAVTSPHRQVTKTDMANFPRFRGEVRWVIVDDHHFDNPAG